MILIITHRNDYTADFLIDKLNQSEIPYFRLNCENIPFETEVSISKGNNFKATIDGHTDFKSVWFRRTQMPNLKLDNHIEAYFKSELQAFHKNLWHSISGTWLSDPEKVYDAENKIYQLRLAQEVGFNVPDTIVSYNINDIKSFFHKNKKEIIIKPLFNNKFVNNEGNNLIYTNKLSEEDLNGLSNSIPLPSIYQKYIEKEVEVRVTVVGEEVFSAFVDSQSNEETVTDWRRKKLPFRIFNLPDELRVKCIKLVKKLGLSFGAIDIIKAKSGEYVFLEINPNGQWAWLEIDTGLPISESLIKFLTK